jgi:hypothetical protein
VVGIIDIHCTIRRDMKMKHPPTPAYTTVLVDTIEVFLTSPWKPLNLYLLRLPEDSEEKSIKCFKAAVGHL